MSYCNGKENLYIHADILQDSCMLYCNILVFALSFFSCSRLLLTMAKNQIYCCFMSSVWNCAHTAFES